ncbi:hypothetical protein [Melioribacter sp. OK-6-Me]|uniref:hypothetical protein n=1 Tax=unclassified Melioribacter TaxID=2627329 RepID=UPI003ED9C6CA
MRNLTLILWLAILVFSCGEPLPTELIEVTNTSEVEFEAVAAESANLDYDSTGIVERNIDKSIVVSVVGVRNTNFRTVQTEGYYYAIFNDKSNPVQTGNGYMLGYKTLQMNSVFFNNFQARKIEHRVKYRIGSVYVDTLLGVKYFASQRMMSTIGRRNDFPYSGKVNFRVISGHGQNIEFDIPTPSEIIGRVRLIGNRNASDAYFDLEWNPEGRGRVEIVFAAINQDGEVNPLMSVKGNDNGNMKVPFKVFKNIIDKDNRSLIVSFVRKIENTDKFIDDSYIVSESIHNIRIDLP